MSALPLLSLLVAIQAVPAAPKGAAPRNVRVPPILEGRDLLRGVNCTYVKVSLDDDLEQEGRLSTSQIQTAVELRLRQNRVRVITGTESVTPECVFLKAEVSALKGRESLEGLWVYALSLEVEDLMEQMRPPYAHAYPVIWSRRTLGLVGSNHVMTLKSSMEAMVDQFLNDLLAANPPR